MMSVLQESLTDLGFVILSKLWKDIRNRSR